MAEICISIAIKIAEYLVDPFIRHARYMFSFNKFVENLQNGKIQLELTLKNTEERAKAVAKRTEKITELVKKWLNDVKDLLEEVRKLEERVEQAKKNCLHVSFRYSLAKQVEQKMQQMEKLNNNSQFEPFSQLIELQGIQYFSSKDFVYFKSTESTCNELLQAIRDDKSYRIGLHGIGGSGKTSLAKEVGKKVLELKLYDKVIIAVVSEPLNIKNIQDQIADQLGLRFEEQSNIGRAQRLSQRLRDERTLIILDDVWEKLDFENIGISSNDSKDYCVLLTTRLRWVCVFMDCQSIIELSLLTEEEAWALFRLRANITNESPNELRRVAEEIANECNELPMAIVTVGSTLRGKSLEEWELALLKLRRSQPLDIAEGLRSPYACLKLSYDNLRHKPIAKSLFLLCSTFPEKHNIHKEDLVRFGIGLLELGENVDTMKEKRGEIYVAVNILLDACLLMPTDEEDCVKMHDLVRDVALWIAGEEGKAIMVARKTIPRNLIENESIKDTEVISLWDLENVKLFNQLQIPTLKILLLHSKMSFKEPNACIGGMKALKVLALMRFSFRRYSTESPCNWSIPQSIESLTNLRYLCLRGSDLGDISILGSLKGLEILDLRGSSFNELPNGIVDMNKLKLLDLYDCSVKQSPYEVIGRCSQLQELYLGIIQQLECDLSTKKWDIQWVAITTFNHLRNQVLPQPLPSFLILVQLGIKKIQVEGIFELQVKEVLDGNPYKEQYSLKLNSKLYALGLQDLPKLRFIWKGPTRILSLQRLEDVILINCPKLKTIFSSTIDTSLPKLRRVVILDCEQFEEIICADSGELRKLSASSHNVCFPKLIHVQIKGCNKLKCLFSYYVACHCPSLESLRIKDCSQLERIVEFEEGEGHGERVLFPKLNYVELVRLPNLTEIFPGFKYNSFDHDIEDCPKYSLPSTST